MILAGIDEAGYGPLLGPLVVGATALRVPPPTPQESSIPDCWHALRTVVTHKKPKRTGSGGGGVMHIADSKAVYSASGGGGIKDLERGVLAFAHAAGLPTDCLESLISAVDPVALGEIRGHRWYVEGSEAAVFPLALSRDSLAVSGSALRHACSAAGIVPVRMAARVLVESRYNDLVLRTRNKASVLFSTVAGLLDGLLADYAHEPGGLLVVCDRQGGRERYGDLLRSMWPDWRLSVDEETPHRAQYTLTAGGSVATIVFCEKGESTCLPTALASMLCKYLREALMARFNTFWAAHVPELTPTAGYYTDGLRFLQDISPALQRLGVEQSVLVRER